MFFIMDVAVIAALSYFVLLCGTLAVGVAAVHLVIQDLDKGAVLY